MRICIIASCAEPVPVQAWGGIESQVEGQARALAALGHDVHVLTVGTAAAQERALLDGVTYHRLLPAVAYDSAPIRRLLPGVVRFTRRAYAACRKLDPEIVHLHARYPSYLWLRWLAPRRARWCTVYHAHNWKLAERMDYGRGSRRALAVRVGAHLDVSIARGCDAVIAISAFMKREIATTAGISETKISVLTNMVAPHMLRVPEAVRDLNVVYVGRIAAEKGLDLLLRAMPAVVARRPETQLTVIGPVRGGTERGGFFAGCARLVDELQLRGHVRFAGMVPNAQLSGWLARARVVAVPSVWNEPCGLAAIEALACGTPVVCTRVGGLPEIVEDGRAGAVVEPHNPAELAAALLRVLADDRLLEWVRGVGRERIAQRHGELTLGRALAGIYERVRAAAGSTWRAVDKAAKAVPCQGEGELTCPR